MNWNIVIIIGLIVALVIAILILRWYINRRIRLKFSQIPEEIIEDFEIAERRLKENKDGKTNPYEILWSTARGREQRRREPFYPGAIGGTQAVERDYAKDDRGEQAVGYAELGNEPEGRQPIPIGTSKTAGAVKRKPKRNWA